MLSSVDLTGVKEEGITVWEMSYGVVATPHPFQRENSGSRIRVQRLGSSGKRLLQSLG